MKISTTATQSILALLCLVAGLLSPSNGVDSAGTKTTSEMIYLMLFIVMMATIAAILIRILDSINYAND